MRRVKCALTTAGPALQAVEIKCAGQMRPAKTAVKIVALVFPCVETVGALKRQKTANPARLIVEPVEAFAETTNAMRLRTATRAAKTVVLVPRPVEIWCAKREKIVRRALPIAARAHVPFYPPRLHSRET